MREDELLIEGILTPECHERIKILRKYLSMQKEGISTRKIEVILAKEYLKSKFTIHAIRYNRKIYKLEELEMI